MYRPYSIAVESPVSREIAQGVWTWIVDPSHPLEAVFAERNGKLVGFTHFRPFPRTLDYNEACFLDDLYVTESERGSGLARQLIENLVRIARERDWTHVRWVTTEGNKRARGLYEKVAENMELVTYKINAAI